MEKQMIISIGRSFGSGGHEIGKRLAEYFHIRLYDKNIITLLAEQTNEDPAKLEKLEETVTGKILPGLRRNGFSSWEGNLMDKLSQSDRMFLLERALIREKAETESFVIVGRAANAILEGFPNTLRMYIYADEAFRIERVKSIYGLDSDQKAKKLMDDVDKRRREYFNYYTDMVWASDDGHDFSIRSSSFGIDQTTEIIIDLAKRRFQLT
ncbi:MAG: cytidylate kinase-like family protein [Lachnospiraceae bacterium]|nr:cytidylate kinase-like family protein [Lachnospiraceae bacterium]